MIRVAVAAALFVVIGVAAALLVSPAVRAQSVTAEAGAQEGGRVSPSSAGAGAGSLKIDAEIAALRTALAAAESRLAESVRILEELARTRAPLTEFQKLAPDIYAARDAIRGIGARIGALAAPAAVARKTPVVERMVVTDRPDGIDISAPSRSDRSIFLYAYYTLPAGSAGARLSASVTEDSGAVLFQGTLEKASEGGNGAQRIGIELRPGTVRPGAGAVFRIGLTPLEGGTQTSAERRFSTGGADALAEAAPPPITAQPDQPARSAPGSGLATPALGDRFFTSLASQLPREMVVPAQTRPPTGSIATRAELISKGKARLMAGWRRGESLLIQACGPAAAKMAPALRPDADPDDEDYLLAGRATDQDWAKFHDALLRNSLNDGAAAIASLGDNMVLLGTDIKASDCAAGLSRVLGGMGWLGKVQTPLLRVTAAPPNEAGPDQADIQRGTALLEEARTRALASLMACGSEAPRAAGPMLNLSSVSPASRAVFGSVKPEQRGEVIRLLENRLLEQSFPGLVSRGLMDNPSCRDWIARNGFSARYAAARSVQDVQPAPSASGMPSASMKTGVVCSITVGYGPGARIQAMTMTVAQRDEIRAGLSGYCRGAERMDQSALCSVPKPYPANDFIKDVGSIVRGGQGVSLCGK